MLEHKDLSSSPETKFYTVTARMLTEGAPEDWLIRFVNTKTPSLTAKDLDELMVFTFPASGEQRREWEPKDAVACHIWVRQLLAGFAAGQPVELQLPRSATIKITPPIRRHTRPSSIIIADDRRASFRAAVFAVLNNTPRYLRCCGLDSCRRYFFTTRGDQQFCKLSCATLHATHLFRARQRAKRAKAAKAAERAQRLKNSQPKKGSRS